MTGSPTAGPAVDPALGAVPHEQRVVSWYGRRDVRVTTKPVPADLAPGWVRVRVAWCGVCGSDTAEFTDGPVVIPHGPDGAAQPLVLGHEISGVVVRAAEPASELVGRRVVTDTLASCGACPACRRGEVNLCAALEVVGLTLDGGLGEYVDVPADTCVVLPDGVGLDVAALAEPLAVAIRAVARAGVRATDRVVVVGLGAVGLLICMLVGAGRSSRAAELVGVDRVAVRRERVGRLAGVPSVSSLRAALGGTARSGPERPGPPGRTVAFECTGNASALAELIAEAGASSRIVLVGAHGRAVPLDLHRFLHAELEMVATLSHSRADMRVAVRTLEGDPARFAALISHRIGLEGTPAVLDSLTAPDTPVVKAIVSPDGARERQ